MNLALHGILGPSEDAAGRINPPAFWFVGGHRREYLGMSLRIVVIAPGFDQLLCGLLSFRDYVEPNDPLTKSVFRLALVDLVENVLRCVWIPAVFIRAALAYGDDDSLARTDVIEYFNLSSFEGQTTPFPVTVLPAVFFINVPGTPSRFDAFVSPACSAFRISDAERRSERIPS
jgi:hypothetical protein